MGILRTLIHEKRGQALVEMALVIPILLMLFFGIIEFGRVFNAYLVLDAASREGARLAAVGGTDAEIVTAVDSAANIFPPEQLQIDIDPQPYRERGDQVRVTVSHNVDLYAPVIANIIGDPYTAHASTVMRVE